MNLPRFSRDKNDVSYISVDQMEQITQKILDEKYGKNYIKEKVDIDFIAEFVLEFNLEPSYLSQNHCYLGMTVFNSSTEIITLDCDNLESVKRSDVRIIKNRDNTILLDKFLYEDGNENLRRFTLAHECGHGFLHRRYFLNDEQQTTFLDEKPQFIACRRIDMGGTTYNRKRKIVSLNDKLEWQANTFASCILMNREALTYYLAEAGLIHANINDIIYGISDHFGVSKAAAEVRLKVLGYFKDKFINASNGLAKQIVF